MISNYDREHKFEDKNHNHITYSTITQRVGKKKSRIYHHAINISCGSTFSLDYLLSPILYVTWRNVDNWRNEYCNFHFKWYNIVFVKLNVIVYIKNVLQFNG